MDDYYPEFHGAAIAAGRLKSQLAKVRENRDLWRDHAENLEQQVSDAHTRIQELEAQLAEKTAALNTAQTKLAEANETIELGRRSVAYLREHLTVGRAFERALAAAVDTLWSALRESSPMYEEICCGVDTPEGFEPAHAPADARRVFDAHLARYPLKAHSLAYLLETRGAKTPLPFNLVDAPDAGTPAGD